MRTRARQKQLTEKIFMQAIESKQADGLVASREPVQDASMMNFCAPDTSEGPLRFMRTVETLNGIAIDASEAFDVMAIMTKSVKFHVIS